MKSRTLATLVATSLIVVACKKKPVPEPAPVAPPAPAPVAAPAAAPAQVVEMVKNFQRVFFDLDASELDASSKAALDANIRIMTEHPDIKVELQGHADERGTTDYNLALGQRRAQAVRRYMTTNGVATPRLKVVSYGEERPLRPGSNESAWSKNRRAEFVITWGDSEAVEGTVQ